MKDCVSLEVAKKLQEAGYKGDCEWMYRPTSGIIRVIQANYRRHLMEGGETYIATPTATQLAEGLPSHTVIDGKKCVLSFWKNTSELYQIGYRDDSSFIQVIHSYAEKTLPDALGLMMVYLLENKLI